MGPALTTTHKSAVYSAVYAHSLRPAEGSVRFRTQGRRRHEVSREVGSHLTCGRPHRLPGTPSHHQRATLEGPARDGIYDASPNDASNAGLQLGRQGSRPSQQDFQQVVEVET